MSDIDRIAEAAWRKFAATEAYNTVDFTCCIRAALIEYGTLREKEVREEERKKQYEKPWSCARDWPPGAG